MFAHFIIAPRAALSMAALVGLVACNETAPRPPVTAIAKVVVTPYDTTATAGTLVQLSAVALDASGNPLNGRRITWQSSNTAIANFIAEGDTSPSSASLTPWKVGVATISAVSEGISGSVTINVVTGPPFAITVDPPNAEILAGTTRQFSALIRDLAGNVVSAQSVVWSSSDTTVTVVDAASGLARGVASGNATISATVTAQVSKKATALVLDVLGGVATTDLGALSFGSSAATSINNLGAVVGSLGDTTSAPHAFVWTAAGGMTDLGPNLIAYAINDYGQVALTPVNAPPNHALRWSQSTGMRDLGVLTGGQTSAAYGINNAGDVVGATDVAGGARHAFLWTEQTGMRDLGLLSSTDNGSFAYSVNDHGQVVGESFEGSLGYCTSYGYYYPCRRAFVWTASQGLTDISGGSDNSSALAVNDSGRIVGVQDYLAFLLNGSVFNVLSPSVVGAASNAYAINTSGQVVGDRSLSDNSGTSTHAFIWTHAGGLQLLSMTPSGARGINDQGQVVGWMTDPKTQATHAVLWTLPGPLAARRVRSTTQSLRRR